MRLKQMLFVGFKSFAERTSIDFRSQLTAIVGPNGCGKSNIVDAFRWALGEQSVKSLRGSSMGDVIFNGTDSRPPAGYAEVVLHLDAPELAPKMGGERHLSIRRKLFRDGTSEYFINGRPCRLKEIRHLLADTGIGATYYSVIGQQNVSAIVEMDSVKRRELLEEAAGVRGYRMQRDAAAGELERAKAHLANITQQITELKQQKRRLEGQASKARRYVKLTESLKNLRLALFELRRKKIEDELALITPQLGDARMKLCSLRTEYEALSADLQERQRLLKRAEQRAAEAEKEKERLSETLKECELSITTAKAETSACLRDIQHLTRQIEFQKTRREDFLLKLRNKEEELKALKQSFASASEELNNLRKESDRLRVTVQELERAKGEVLRLREGVLDEEVRLKNEAADARRQIERLEKEKSRLLAEQKEIKAVMEENAAKAREFRERREDAERRLSSLVGEEAELKKQIDSLKRRIEWIRRRSEAVVGEVAHLRMEAETLKRLLAERSDLKGIDKVVESLAREGHKVYKLADFVECGAGGENVSRTLSLLLSPIERTLIVEDEGAVRAFLSRRSELGNPQIKFVVLSRLPSEVPPLPEGVIVRPEAELCVRYLCSGARVTPDPFSSEGSVCFNYEGVVVRGATVEVCGDELSLLEIKHRIRQIESRESFLLSRKTQLEGRLASLGEFFSERGVTLETLQSKISLVRKDVDGLKAEEEWLVRERGDIERRLSLFDSEMEFCVNEEERLKGVLISSENALRNATSAMEEIRLKQASVDERLRDARESLFKLQNKESEAGVKVARLEEQLNAREKELREMECFLNNTTEEMEKNLSAVEDIRRKQKSLEDRIKEAEKRREDSLARIAAIVREREELSANLELLRTTVEQLGSRRDEIYRATEGQSQVEQNLALKDTALREQLQSLMRQASEMGFDVSSVSIDFDALELGGEVTEERLKTEIESVEHKISALGSINQTAAEEMEAVEGRLQFFSLQEADLTDAVKRLTSTIAKLDEHCKKKLEEVFEKVKTNFSELFRRLFNGGSAELSLTSENILEAGIEVMARPPCKKNSTIMQLSGGERAMCAIAFLFSIYKTRPSPVCLLDELDAPLDEMNVSSFISLLREFSQSTQFLVITHSKQTIAGMDDAIGVTMGTPGVSNIVSVSITEAAELAAQSL